MRNFKILTVNKKVIGFILIVALISVSVGIFFGVKAVIAKPNIAPTIVIDAGHGGLDVK